MTRPSQTAKERVKTMFDPIFIPVGEARELLNIRSRRTIQDLLARRILPHLSMGSNRTRRLPRRYVLGLARHLNKRSATAPLVREFNATEEARRLVGDAKTRLLTAINSRPRHTLDEAGEILGVERNTVNNWVLDGTLRAEVEPRKGMIVDPANPLSQKYAIKAEALRSFVEWVTPI